MKDHVAAALALLMAAAATAGQILASFVIFTLGAILGAAAIVMADAYTRRRGR